MLARCCYLFVALSVIFVFVFTFFFHVVSESTCEGEWGVGNLGEEKTGIGRCVWRFGLTSVLTNSSLFLRETIYEGGWLRGTKHGFGKYRSFSNVVYEGFWKENKREGDGIMIINDKARYTGKWNNDTLTCDDATLTLVCNNTCVQYPSLLLKASMIYKGKVARGLPHGQGVISFSDSSRKIQITFYHGVVQDHSRGTLTLASDRVIEIDSFRETWEFMQHTANAELSYTTPSGSRTQYSWDGQRLVIDGNVSSAYTAQNSSHGAQNAAHQRNATHGSQNNIASQWSQEAEVFELLNSLKWFEYHFIKTQMMLESEVYSFDTAEQYQQELEQKLKEAEEKEKPASQDTKEL